jgi:hypothetical protein
MELRENSFSRPPAPSQPESKFDPDALTRALRIAGAILVVASASTFMLQHWQQSGNDLIRYAMLVGQSLMLAAAAYFVGLSMREGRSARTFLALVLATIPVSFAVLGGLVYSVFHLEAVAVLPHYATWIAPSKASALMAVGGTLAVLVPLGVVSFVALARKEAKALSLAFFAANLLVLVPVRQPLVIVGLAGVALLGLLRLELTRFAATAQLDTIEGKLARAMPFVPPVIMLGRVLHLYHAGAAFMGGILLVGSAALWLLLGRVQSSSQRDLGAWLASALGIGGWALCWTELGMWSHTPPLSVLSWGLPMAALVAVGALRAVKSRDVLVGIATVGALLTVLIACILELGTISGLCCIVLGIAVAVWGASVKALLRVVAGSMVALFGLGVQVWLAVQHDNLLRWASLSVVGVLLIVGSAYVERHRGKLVRLWQEASARRLREQESL